MQPCLFVKAEHKVHVLNCLPYSSLQEVVDAGYHQQLVFVLLHIDQSLVGIDNLLHVRTLLNKVRKGSILIVVGIDALNFLQKQVTLSIGSNKNATSETAPLGDEEQSAFIARAKFLYGLVDFQEVLMCEGLIDGDIVVAPREMRRCPWLLASSSAACNAVHVNVATDDACLQCGQHGELDASSKATWVCKVLAALYRRPMRFRQAINIVVFASYAKVLCKVDYFDICWYLMLFEELFALAVTKAEEDDIYLIERHFTGKLQLCVAYKPFVNFIYLIPGI